MEKRTFNQAQFSQDEGLDAGNSCERFLASSRIFNRNLGIDIETFSFNTDQTELRFIFIPGAEAQGFPKIAHGGYMAAILDNGNVISMLYADRFKKQALNAHIEIDFKKPMTLDGSRYTMVSKLCVIKEQKKVEVTSTIVNEAGEVICIGRSMVVIK